MVYDVGVVWCSVMCGVLCCGMVWCLGFDVGCCGCCVCVVVGVGVVWCLVVWFVCVWAWRV